MKDRPFRFGVVATPQDGEQWRSTARRVADPGYCCPLMPDGMQLLSPFPSLAAAAPACGSALRDRGFAAAAALDRVGGALPYLSVDSACFEQLAPVVEALNGQ